MWGGRCLWDCGAENWLFMDVVCEKVVISCHREGGGGQRWMSSTVYECLKCCWSCDSWCFCSGDLGIKRSKQLIPAQDSRMFFFRFGLMSGMWPEWEDRCCLDSMLKWSTVSVELLASRKETLEREEWLRNSAVPGDLMFKKMSSLGLSLSNVILWHFAVLL